MVVHGSLAARILTLLGERYPITLRQVALGLGTRPDAVEREARKLAAQGLVVLEPLGNDVWIALSGRGRDPPRAGGGRGGDEHDPAFG